MAKDTCDFPGCKEAPTGSILLSGPVTVCPTCGRDEVSQVQVQWCDTHAGADHALLLTAKEGV